MLLPGFLPDQPLLISVPNGSKPETLQVSSLTFWEQSPYLHHKFLQLLLLLCDGRTDARFLASVSLSSMTDGRSLLSLSFVDILPSRNSLCHLNTNGRLTERPFFACSRSCWVSVGFFPRLTQNLIKTRCSSFDGVSIVDVLSRRYYYNDLR